MQLPIFAIV